MRENSEQASCHRLQDRDHQSSAKTRRNTSEQEQQEETGKRIVYFKYWGQYNDGSSR